MTGDLGRGPAAFDPRVTAALADLGVDLRLVGPEMRIEEFVTEMGEPAFAWLVLSLEAHLPEPFPEELLDEIDTLDDLLWFAETKRSHQP